jgi:HD-like signal output (HDOD) protein
MPEEVVEALKHQHNPDFDGDKATCANLLYVAVRCLRLQGFGDGPWEEPEAQVLERLGIEQESAMELTANLLDRMDELSELIQMLNK